MVNEGGRGSVLILLMKMPWVQTSMPLLHIYGQLAASPTLRCDQ